MRTYVDTYARTATQIDTRADAYGCTGVPRHVAICRDTPRCAAVQIHVDRCADTQRCAAIRIHPAVRASLRTTIRMEAAINTYRELHSRTDIYNHGYLHMYSHADMQMCATMETQRCTTTRMCVHRCVGTFTWTVVQMHMQIDTALDAKTCTGTHIDVDRCIGACRCAVIHTCVSADTKGRTASNMRTCMRADRRPAIQPYSQTDGCMDTNMCRAVQIYAGASTHRGVEPYG